MKAPLPSVAVISGMMLATAILSAVAIVGPVPAPYEILKDFQPIIAAVIALAGGTLAYRGAMAKVDLDRENSERERTGRKLGLFLRLRSRTSDLHSNAVHEEWLANDALGANVLKAPKMVDYDVDQTCTIADFAELSEAWSQLDLLPRETADVVATLRSKIKFAIDTYGRLCTDADDDGKVPRHTLRLFRRNAEDVVKTSQSLIAILDAAIEQLKHFD